MSTAEMAPVAEMLAVVAQQVIGLLTHSRAGAPSNFLRSDAVGGTLTNSARPAVSKVREGNLLDLPTSAVEPAGIVDYPAVADIDAVMPIEAPLHDELCPGHETGKRILEKISASLARPAECTAR